MYEWATSFDREVQYFWGKPITGATLLFLFSRYFALFSYSYDLTRNIHMSDQVINYPPSNKIYGGSG